MGGLYTDAQIVKTSTPRISMYSSWLSMSAQGSWLQRFPEVFSLSTVPHTAIRSLFCWKNGSVVLCFVDTQKWVDCVFSGRHSLYQVSWLHVSSCSPSFSTPHSWGETANTVRHRLQPAMNKPFRFLPLIIHFSRFSCLVTHFLSEVVCWYDWHLILYREV